MLLVASFAAIDCGGDDTTPAAGGSAGTAGGSAGAAGQAGSAAGQSGSMSGGAGQGGGGAAGQGGGDAGPKADAPSDATAALVPFQSVVDILTAQCTGCHKSNDGSVTGLIDLQTTAGLYARLTSPLPTVKRDSAATPTVEPTTVVRMVATGLLSAIGRRSCPAI